MLANPTKTHSRTINMCGYFVTYQQFLGNIVSGAGTILGQGGKTESAKIGNAK